SATRRASSSASTARRLLIRPAAAAGISRGSGSRRRIKGIMTSTISPVRGMNDVLPDDEPLWERLESAAAALFKAYDYHRIRIPVLEKTELFSRSIGETTDIVEKEMYTFEDRGGDSLTLRPE